MTHDFKRKARDAPGSFGTKCPKGKNETNKLEERST